MEDIKLWDKKDFNALANKFKDFELSSWFEQTFSVSEQASIREAYNTSRKDYSEYLSMKPRRLRTITKPYIFLNLVGFALVDEQEESLAFAFFDKVKEVESAYSSGVVARGGTSIHRTIDTYSNEYLVHFELNTAIVHYYKQADKSQAILACQQQIAIAGQVRSHMAAKSKHERPGFLQRNTPERLEEMRLFNLRRQEFADQLNRNRRESLKLPPLSPVERQDKVYEQNKKRVEDESYVTMPIHLGFKNLSIIREKEGNHLEALRLVEEAKRQGWQGDWDTRIERLTKRAASKK